MKVQKLNRRQVRQVLYLSIFDFILKYVPGTKIGKTDGLSKRSDQKVEVEKDSDNQVLIKDQWIYSLTEVVIEGPEVDIIEKIKIARSKNKEVVRDEESKNESTARRRMVDKRRFGIKEEESIYAKR